MNSTTNDSDTSPGSTGEDNSDTEPAQYLIREFVPSDYNYIISTWLRELRACSSSPLNDQEWFTAHRAFVDRCLASRNVTVKILCATDDHNEILSYIVGVDNQAIIWVHTKRAFRTMGLATNLIGELCPNQKHPLLAFRSRARHSLLRGRLSPLQVSKLI